MNCIKCGVSNAATARFCSGCGAGLAGSNPFNQAANTAGAAPAAAAARARAVDEEEVTQVHPVSAGAANAGEREQPAREHDPYLGQVIDGKYRIDAKIGMGGMGAVYRAARLQIGDEVAIKILNTEHVSEPQARERFQREAQAAARLKHPNAVFIVDFGITSAGLVYLVMELLHGESLRQLIKQEGPLAEPVVAEILNQVCAALDEAHRLQIVHRDLKPDNINVKTTIKGLQVKVLDFGIAKLRDLATSNLTQTGSVMGTPRYMSPEQCMGEEIDSRSDIYSLGIVLYEMLAGVVPFNRPTSTAVVLQQVNEPPPPLRAVNPAVSPAVEAVVLQALAKSRAARPQSARALAAAFSAAVNSPTPVISRAPDLRGPETTVVMPPTRRTNTGKTNPAPDGGQAGQNKIPVPLIVVGALALLAIGALVAVLLVQRGGTTNNNAAASPQPTIDTSHNASSSPGTSGGQVSAQDLSATVPAPAPVVPQPQPAIPILPEQFQRAYRGQINGKSFSMTLQRSGSQLSGKAATNSSWDTLSGSIKKDGSFTLDGYESGVVRTGIYSGRIQGGTVTGRWTTTDGLKPRGFSARE